MCQNSEFQRAPSRVDVWRRREGLTSHAMLQRANCAEEDCSLEASSKKVRHGIKARGPLGG